MSTTTQPAAPGRERALVHRDRAVNRCLDARTPIVLLLAPAGYGKTTTLSQWEAADPRPFHWISADWRHNDPAFLLAALAGAIDAVEPLDDDVLAPLAAPSPNLDLVASRICDAVAGLERELVIVIDDLHLVGDPESLRLLLRVIEAVPAGSAIAAAARDTPSLPLARLRAGRMLSELRVDELTMGGAEAGELLEGAGLALAPEQVERLVGRTEGWAAGLYLAALSLRDADDVEAGLERFYGDERVVAEYLRDEFLAGLSGADLDFLIRTSVLDRLQGALCDAVLDRDGSAAVLSRLSRSNLLLVPLDGRDREYRAHALLREMLAAELHRLDRAEEAELHGRAGRWYAGAGDYDHAVPHAVAAGDLEYAGGLIWSQAAEYTSRGRSATFRAWVDQFAEPQIEASPPLCLAAAARHLNVGDGARVERWTGAAFAALAADAHPDRVELEAAARLIRAAGAARDGVARMGEDVAGLDRMLPEASPWRSLACLIEGVSLHLRGERARARARLEEGARRGSATAPSIEALSRAQLALVGLDEGDLDGAVQETERAFAAAERHGLGEDPTQALTFAVVALVWAARGRTDRAARELAVAGRLLGMLDDLSPWYEAEARIVIARACLLLDDVGGARSRLAEAGRHLRRSADAEVLREWLERAWQDVDAAQATNARWPLTPAELRLLHRLPTHLSFREIAEELFVSSNTVKSQARSIYRKLGVSSRAEAVACASTAGLLAPAESGRNHVD